MDNTPKNIAEWLACLGFGLWITNQIMNLARGLRGPVPQPPNDQLAASHAELARRIGVLEADSKSRTAGMYRKIDETRSELKTDLENMDDKFDRKLESLPEKLINLLRNTGAIGGSH